jgi:hypothetical protein
MHLEFQNLAEWSKLNRKLKQSLSSYWVRASQDEIDGWRLQMFTCDKESKQESVRNLDRLKQKAEEIEAPVLIVKGDNFQFVGMQQAIVATDLVDQEWMDTVSEYFDRKNYYSSKPFWTHHESNNGDQAYSLHTYGADAVFARTPQTGFYLLGEDRKVTDRREQIQLLWDYGFVARRGRPVSVGWERHSGSPDEIAMITRQARQMWHRRHSSEVAAKMCSIYTSINRYYAWPGSW